MRPPGPVGYLRNVQILRLLAALMVLLAHLEHETADHRIAGMGGVVDPTGMAWQSGVDVFFVISGFIMFHLTAEHFATPGYPWEFLKRRLVRVAPLYWIFTTLMVVAIAVFPGRVRHLDATPLRIAASYLFIPTLRADGVGVPVLALGWTLNYEMVFYATYALALLAPRRIGLTLLACGFALLAALSAAIPADLDALQFWSHPIILEFLFGIGLAVLFRQRRHELSPAIALLIVVAGFAFLALSSPILTAPRPLSDRQLARPFLAGLPALMIAAGLVLGPTIGGRIGRALARGGDASYAIYLSHPFALNLLAIAWTRGHLPPNGWLYLTAGFIACIGAGWATHMWIEAPLLSLLRRRFEPRRGSLAA